MAYEKQIWTTGETITADKLNHMEDGIADGGSGGDVLFIHLNYDEQSEIATLDKTAIQIADAMRNGIAILTIDGSEDNVVLTKYIRFSELRVAETNYRFKGYNAIDQEEITFYASSDEEYPTDQIPAPPIPPIGE